MLVLHYTGMATAEGACRWLCDPNSQVSCHYLVDEDGRITQLAGEEMRAWHAGVSCWEGESDINSRSIGIEIHNPGPDIEYRDYSDRQMAAVIALCKDIVARHAIAPRYVLGHSDVAPGRKIDPGEKFDWQLLHREGVGHWVPPAPLKEGEGLAPGDEGEAVTRLQSRLAAFGYGIPATGRYDERTCTVVAAFQRHFRPARIDGLADHSTLNTLERLLEALG
jgi:N-acetylmuramoyl-L-alanine amidase